MSSASPAPAVPIEALQILVRDAEIVNRSGVAASACLIFDIFITLDQEVEYIWKSAWTFPKALYLFSRYFTLVVQIVNITESTDLSVTDNYCHNWTSFEGICGQLIVMGVEIILMLRLYALYKRDKRILALMLVSYIAEVTANSVILGLGLSQIMSIAPLRGIFPPEFPYSGCFPVNVPRFFFSYWIPTLIFESLLFALMIINFVRVVRVHSSMKLLTLFVRDGMVFYAVIFVTLLTQVLLYETVNSALAQVAIAWELTMFSIAGSRLILNLRAYAAQPAAETLEMIAFDTHVPQTAATSTAGAWRTSHAALEPESPLGPRSERPAGLWAAKAAALAETAPGAQLPSVEAAREARGWMAEWE